MDNNLYQMIFKRKSFHFFRNVGKEKISEEELNLILNKYRSFTPLYDNIKTDIKIVPEKQTDCRRGGEYCIMLYSEKKDGYLQNIGYLGEQLDLFLATENIGALWYGIGKSKEQYNNLDYVIMIAIRKIDDSNKFRKDMYKSKRKSCEEIWQGEYIDGITDIVRFAPSACNSQPWLVKNQDNELAVYRYKKSGRVGIIPSDRLSYFNQIDLGIFMCFLEVCLEHNNISYTKQLFYEQKTDSEFYLNAKYEIK